MPEAQTETSQENGRLVVQFPREEFDDPIAELKDFYKYETPALAIRNCVRVGLKLHQKNPEEFIILLNN